MTETEFKKDIRPPKLFKYKPRCTETLTFTGTDGQGSVTIKCKLLADHFGLHQCGVFVATNKTYGVSKQSYHIIWESSRWL